MVKGYLLAVAEFATTTGFTLGLFPILIFGILLIALGHREAGTSLMCVGFVAGITLAVIQTHCRSTYIAHVDDYKDLWVDGRLVLLKVKDGRVLAAGLKFWGKDNVCLVGIPYAWDGKFETQTKISRKIGEVTISIVIGLTAYLREGEEESGENPLRGFQAQELFDNVVQSGCLTVGEWLAGAFKEAAEKTPAIQIAFAEYGRGTPFLFASAIQEALRQVSFKCRLSNVTSVAAMVEVASPSFVVKVSYS